MASAWLVAVPLVPLSAFCPSRPRQEHWPGVFRRFLGSIFHWSGAGVSQGSQPGGLAISFPPPTPQPRSGWWPQPLSICLEPVSIWQIPRQLVTDSPGIQVGVCPRIRFSGQPPTAGSRGVGGQGGDGLRVSTPEKAPARP